MGALCLHDHLVVAEIITTSKNISELIRIKLSLVTKYDGT